MKPAPSSIKLFSAPAFLILVIVFLSFFKTSYAVIHPEVLKSRCDTVPVVDTSLKVFEKVDIEASYPGGETAWRSFLEQNLNANTPVDKGAPAGAYTVWIQFIVATDGTLSDLKMLTHHGYGMEMEVMRILRRSPHWSPAEQDGRKVKAYRKQPVTFVVEEEKKGRRRKD